MVTRERPIEYSHHHDESAHRRQQQQQQQDHHSNASRDQSQSISTDPSSSTTTATTVDTMADPTKSQEMQYQPQYAMPKKPIDEAVTTAFDRADTANVVPPELIAQITQSVIKQLQSGSLEGSTTPVPPTQNPYPPPPPSSANAAGQTASGPASSYTVPAPSMHQQPPPPPVPQQPSHSQHQQQHPQAHHHQHHQSYVPPQIHQPIPQSPSTASGTSPRLPHRVYTPPSPHKDQEHSARVSPPPNAGSVHSSSQSPVASTEKKFVIVSPDRVASPASQSSDGSDKHQPSRPRGPPRLNTGTEETTLERIWGQLFDEDSRPTARLGQLLRGLAIHLIEDFEPKHSIVITPPKIVHFYERVKLSQEFYPWSTIFDDEHSSISRMYRDLMCQHHLVQERFDERPDIPGLTPLGFERWMTLMIQADPEAEFGRLQKAVLEMPISNPDDKKERFPKEISRRLFPKTVDRRVRDLVEESMMEHASISLPRRLSQDDLKPTSTAGTGATSGSKHATVEPVAIPPTRPSVSFAEPEATSAPNRIERERAPYANVHDTAVIDDTNPPEPPNTKPIERERKPYSAQVGGGKQYEAEDLRGPASVPVPAMAAAAVALKPRADSVASNGGPPPSKTHRSESMSGRSRPINLASHPASNLSSGPVNSSLPKPEIHQYYPPRAGSTASTTSRRRRSPSFSRGSTNEFRRSDIYDGGVSSNNSNNSNIPGGPPAFDEQDTKRYFDEQARQRARRRAATGSTDDDAYHRYGESPRRDRERDRNYDSNSGSNLRRADYKDDEEYWRAGGGRRERTHDDSGVYNRDRDRDRDRDRERDRDRDRDGYTRTYI